MNRCEAKRRDGRRCEAKSLPGRRCCTFHDASTAEVRSEGRKKGGVARSGTSTLPADSEPLKLESAGDVLFALTEAFNGVRCGRLGVREGNCLGLLATAVLKAIENRTAEAELSELRAKVDELTAARRRTR